MELPSRQGRLGQRPSLSNNVIIFWSVLLPGDEPDPARAAQAALARRSRRQRQRTRAPCRRQLRGGAPGAPGHATQRVSRGRSGRGSPSSTRRTPEVPRPRSSASSSRRTAAARGLRHRTARRYAPGFPQPGRHSWFHDPRRAGLPTLEQVVAAALALSHRDAAVARVLPLVLWRHRNRLDHEELVRRASLQNEGQALGFFLELAGALGRDAPLKTRARALRDRRRTRARPFFTRVLGRRELALVRARTPALARRWGYLLNMDLDSFVSAFDKHRDAA